MPEWLTVEIGIVETVKGGQEKRKWTPGESLINPVGQRRWAKPPDLSKTIMLELSKNNIIYLAYPALLRFWPCSKLRGLVHRWRKDAHVK